MNLIKSTIAFLTIFTLFSACTKVDVPVENELTPENFPKTEAQFLLASGAAYAKFRDSYCNAYWQAQSLSTDEAILPTRGSNWYDGGRYKEMHYHSWTADNAIVSGAWTWGFSTISSCNQILALFAQSPDSEAKLNIMAEIRTLRAITYFMMMDLYGNIPVITTFGDAALPKTQNRSAVFAFIEKDVLEALPRLSEVIGTATYGRPTKYAAYALLAKMYLNAEVYTGTPRYNDVVTMCDNVTKSGKYVLADDYFGMFKPNNGAATPEFIFAIPYESNQAKNESFTWYGLHYGLSGKFGLSWRISGPTSTIPEYYANFDTPGDVRNDCWVTGKQFDFSGNPVTILTTKKGLDANYTGADGADALNWQLEFSPNITLVNVANFDAGSDVLSSAKGIRNMKYYPDAAAIDRNANNDVPVFRYADILLMKAEAILRGATATNGQTALSIVNDLRGKRKATQLSALSLNELLRERAREMNWETWRRNDLIRFGKYEESWGFKTDKDVNKRLFPVPASERILNPGLAQNPGY